MVVVLSSDGMPKADCSCSPGRLCNCHAPTCLIQSLIFMPSRSMSSLSSVPLCMIPSHAFESRVATRSFEKRFRLLVRCSALRCSALAQLFFGLMPEFIIPSVRPMVLFPEFMGSLADLFFCWFGHISSATLKRSPPWGACRGDKGQSCAGHGFQNMARYTNQIFGELFRLANRRELVPKGYLALPASNDNLLKWLVAREGLEPPTPGL
jgi:hypothetical protein